MRVYVVRLREWTRWRESYRQASREQRCGTYFYYKRAAIGLVSAKANAVRIDIATHKRLSRRPLMVPPTPTFSTSPHVQRLD